MTAQPNPHHKHPHQRQPVRNAGDEMLTLQEACTYLRIPEGTLRYWRHLGTGPRGFRIGRSVRYWRTEVHVWLEEQSHPPQATR